MATTASSRNKKARPKGRFIVIDGADGSGKTTQVNLLLKRLKKEGFSVGRVNFPRYGKKSAILVEEYLRGAFGKAGQVNPYAASALYAIDRFAATKNLRKLLATKDVVISDRYTSANMGHQAAKFSPAKRRSFLRWLYELEHKHFEIPEPDLTLIVTVPISITQRLIKSRGNTLDSHETDTKHLRDATATYQMIAKLFARFRLISCVDKSQLLPPEQIHEKIWKKVEKQIKNKR